MAWPLMAPDHAVCPPFGASAVGVRVAGVNLQNKAITLRAPLAAPDHAPGPGVLPLHA